MEIKALCGKTSYIETRWALIPLYYLSEREVVLFDSGVEPEEELLTLLDREGLRVRAVLSTHLHPDHIANNEALVERHGAEVFAHYPEIPVFYQRFGTPYSVTPIPDGDTFVLEGVPFRTLSIPGHSVGHLLFVTPDGVVCVGDAIITDEELNRSKIPYMDDVDRAIISMEDLRQTRYPWYIVAHKGVVPGAELYDLVERNIQKELDLYELVRRCLTGPMELEELVTAFIRASGVRSEKMVEENFVRHTARVRILALAGVGEFSVEGDMVIPCR